MDMTEDVMTFFLSEKLFALCMITIDVSELWLLSMDYERVPGAHLVPVACIRVPDLLNEVEYEPC